MVLLARVSKKIESKILKNQHKKSSKSAFMPKSSFITFATKIYKSKKTINTDKTLLCKNSKKTANTKT